MSTELVVKTITFEPAKIEFNFEQLSEILDQNLAKYDGIEFTEKTANECRKTIAELRKGKRLLDTYRKDTKKELSVAITSFEDQCKELAAKFDNAIDPLTEQFEQFEHDRKERKRKQIQEVIDELITEQGLNEKFSVQLAEFPDEYYNKGKSMKDIKAELAVRAESLGIAQDKEAADIEIIRTTVKLANSEYNVKLTEAAYVRLLEFKDVSDIKSQILDDVHDEVEKQLEKSEKTKPSVKVVDLDDADEIFVETFVIEGTESQLQALEDFLENNTFTWKIIDD